MVEGTEFRSQSLLVGVFLGKIKEPLRFFYET